MEIHKHPEVKPFYKAYIVAREGARNALDRVSNGEIDEPAYFDLMDRVAVAQDAYLVAWKRVYDNRLRRMSLGIVFTTTGRIDYENHDRKD
jgi:hypothetical protein